MKIYPLLVLALTMTPHLWAQPRFQPLYRFTGTPDGATPLGLSSGPDGVLYGATTYGGVYGMGTVFQLAPPSSAGGNWTETVLYSFGANVNDGYYPTGAPAVGANGVLYGLTQFGGGEESYGTAYALTPPSSPGGAWTETILADFLAVSDTIDGYPAGSLVIGASGELYGITSEGSGSYGYGTVFELTPPGTLGGTWTLTTLYAFSGDSIYPAGISLASTGAIFGTTRYGGNYGAGTIFELLPPSATGGAWTYIMLYAFGAGDDGAVPAQPPVVAADGNLYGSTTGGGSGNAGTVYQLTPGAGGIWSETVLYSFAAADDGKLPDSPLIIESGVIYGATNTGSGTGYAGGTIFSLRDPGNGGPWIETILHSYGALAGPYGSLVMNHKGILYGTTAYGPGSMGVGTAYQVKP